MWYSGFSISWVSASNTLAQTCVVTATSTSFVTVQCDSGTFVEFSAVTVPNTVSDKVLSSYVLFAPLYQLNFKASDVPAKTTTTSTTPTSSLTSTPLTLPTTGIPSPTSSSASSAPTSTSASSTTPGTNVPASTPDPSGGLSAGAKAGIGVGVALGTLLLVALAFLFFRQRKRKQNATTTPTDSSAAGTGAGVLNEKAARSARPQAELSNDEVRELDGRPVAAELPTRLPSDRIPPGRRGPLFRRSDQTWIVSPTDGTFEGGDGIVSPVEPHGDAVFELEGDTTPRSSAFESRRIR